MNLPFSNTTLILGIVVLLVVVAVAIGIVMKFRKNRTEVFRKRFGSEYDRAVQEHGSAKKAEAKLATREARVEAMKIRDIGPAEIQRFTEEWKTVQSRFVDHPQPAVAEADELINSLLAARGYPQSTFEQRAADLSVSYPHVMENYRKAHDIAVRRGRDNASTEDLRNAMINYRSIFEELIQPQRASAAA